MDMTPIQSLIEDLAQYMAILDTSDQMDSVEMSEELYDIQPGDKGNIVYTPVSTQVKDWVMGEVLPAESLAAEFPDWESRARKGYLLVRWFSIYDPIGGVAWFHRLRFTKMDDDEYTALVSMRNEGVWPPKREHIGEWVDIVHQRGVDRLNRYHPDMPQRLTCGECGSRELEVAFTKISSGISEEIYLTQEDGQEHFVFNLGPDGPTNHHTCTIRCKECGWSRQVSEGNWRIGS